MATTVLVRLQIPFGPSGGELVFHHWIPLDENEGVVIQHGDTKVQLWFDLQCSTLSEADLVDIDRRWNVLTLKVNVDIEIRGVSEELAEFIYEEGERPALGPEENPDDRYNRLRSEYLELGKEVLKSAVGAFNRLILYARIMKGQHWLEHRQINFDRMPSDFTEFHAKVKVEDHDWIKWFPTSHVLIRVPAIEATRFIMSDDWPQAKAFIAGQGKPDLTLEILANSEALAAFGYRRSAIIEAVTALEVAISRFSQFPKLDSSTLRAVMSRVDLGSLRTQVDHLGFSGTLRFLLPLLFTEELLPTSLIDQCSRAVEIRGNVVHQGQRDVDQETLVHLLQAIRTVCETLGKFTAHTVS